MTKARDIMTREVHCVKAATPIQELARSFAEKKVSGFPVLDADGGLAGVVTESDLIHQNQRLHIPTVVALFDSVIVLGSSKRLEEEIRQMSATRVDEIMNRDPVTVLGETPVEDVARLMAERHVDTIPVLDEAGALIGVIGKRDVIRAMAGP